MVEWRRVYDAATTAAGVAVNRLEVTARYATYRGRFRHWTAEHSYRLAFSAGLAPALVPGDSYRRGFMVDGRKLTLSIDVTRDRKTVPWELFARDVLPKWVPNGVDDLRRWAPLGERWYYDRRDAIEHARSRLRAAGTARGWVHEIAAAEVRDEETVFHTWIEGLWSYVDLQVRLLDDSGAPLIAVVDGGFATLSNMHIDVAFFDLLPQVCEAYAEQMGR